jgi:hypothetical protein
MGDEECKASSVCVFTQILIFKSCRPIQ